MEYLVDNKVKGAVRDIVEEKLVWNGHASQLINAGWFLFAVFGLAFSLIPYVGWLITFGIGLWVTFKYVQTRCHAYRLTNTGVEEEKGIFSRAGDQVDLHRVYDVSHTQNFVQRIFGLGDVQLISDDRTHPLLVLKYIHGPRAVADAIRRYSQASKDRLVDAS